MATRDHSTVARKDQGKCGQYELLKRSVGSIKVSDLMFDKHENRARITSENIINKFHQRMAR